MKQFSLSIKLALHNLKINKGRTVLTLVGIVIGITSVIVVMSSGQGLKNYILGQFSSYGTDEISIKPKIPNVGKASVAGATQQAQGVTVTTLKHADSKEIIKLPNVADAVDVSVGQKLVSYQNQNKRTILYGAGADIPLVDTGVKIDQGEFYTQSDDNSLAQVTVIGSNVAENLFGQDNPLGKEIKINNMNFKVIGVLQSRGAVTFFNFDDLIYVPEQTLQKKILGVDYVQGIVVKVKDVSIIDATVADIKDPSRDDFQAVTVQEALDMIASVFNTITILILALTSISLVVGGVGIMNVMYVAIVERTFEIGLRKAVGAKSRDILRQFLFEAVIITLIGGIVGIIMGFALSLAFSYIFATLGYALQLSVTLNSIIVAVGFSAATGIIFGFYPAYKASKLSPMEALRRE
jgi:ABC-type antimicrobial peptide transport system permease subunit